MSSQDQRTTSRNIPATAVPSGERVTIPEGSIVTITHRLGGNFTVLWDYGMARITGEYADAIGETVEKQEEAANAAANHEGPPNEEEIWTKLKAVFDPEIPVNIVDLGLVYSMEVKEEEGKYNVEVKMTLTAPGCGMGPAIAEDAKYKVQQVPGVNEARVDLVWEPAWHQEMISEEGKMQLGLI